VKDELSKLVSHYPRSIQSRLDAFRRVPEASTNRLALGLGLSVLGLLGVGLAMVGVLGGIILRVCCLSLAITFPGGVIPPPFGRFALLVLAMCLGPFSVIEGAARTFPAVALFRLAICHPHWKLAAEAGGRHPDIRGFLAGGSEGLGILRVLRVLRSDSVRLFALDSVKQGRGGDSRGKDSLWTINNLPIVHPGDVGVAEEGIVRGGYGGEETVGKHRTELFSSVTYFSVATAEFLFIVS